MKKEPLFYDEEGYPLYDAGTATYLIIAICLIAFSGFMALLYYLSIS